MKGMVSRSADWIYAARFARPGDVAHKRARRQGRAREKRQWRRDPESA